MSPRKKTASKSPKRKSARQLEISRAVKTGDPISPSPLRTNSPVTASASPSNTEEAVAASKTRPAADAKEGDSSLSPIDELVGDFDEEEPRSTAEGPFALKGAKFGPYGSYWLATAASNDPVWMNDDTLKRYWTLVAPEDAEPVQVQPPAHCEDHLFPVAASRWQLQQYIPRVGDKVCALSRSRGPSCYLLPTDTRKSQCHYRFYAPAFLYDVQSGCPLQQYQLTWEGAPYTPEQEEAAKTAHRRLSKMPKSGPITRVAKDGTRTVISLTQSRDQSLLVKPTNPPSPAASKDGKDPQWHDPLGHDTGDDQTLPKDGQDTAHDADEGKDQRNPQAAGKGKDDGDEDMKEDDKNEEDKGQEGADKGENKEQKDNGKGEREKEDKEKDEDKAKENKGEEEKEEDKEKRKEKRKAEVDCETGQNKHQKTSGDDDDRSKRSHSKDSDPPMDVEQQMWSMSADMLKQIEERKKAAEHQNYLKQAAQMFGDLQRPPLPREPQVTNPPDAPPKASASPKPPIPSQPPAATVDRRRHESQPPFGSGERSQQVESLGMARAILKTKALFESMPASSSSTYRKGPTQSVSTIHSVIETDMAQTFTERYSVSQTYNQALESAIEQLQEKLNHIKDLDQKAEADVTARAARIKANLAKSAEFEEQNSTLRTELKEKSSLVRSLQDQIQRLDQELAAEKAERLRAVTEKNLSRADIENYKRLADDNRKELNVALAQLEGLQEESGAKSNKIEELQHVGQSVWKEYQDHKELATTQSLQIETLQQLVNETKQKNLELQTSMEAKDEENSQLLSEHHALQQQIGQLQMLLQSVPEPSPSVPPASPVPTPGTSQLVDVIRSAIQSGSQTATSARTNISESSTGLPKPPSFSPLESPTGHGLTTLNPQMLLREAKPSDDHAEQPPPELGPDPAAGVSGVGEGVSALPGAPSGAETGLGSNE